MTVDHFLNPLEMKIWDVLKEYQPREILFAMSGGLDSSVGIHLLKAVESRYECKIRVCHIHHGFSKNPAQESYRDQAAAFVERIASQLEFDFVLKKNSSDKVLLSEEDLRDFREEMFNGELLENEVLMLSQHKDDLLETRLIRLIRGTGGQGLEAMSALKAKKFRPLLNISREELELYAKEKGIEYLEDPSNSDNTYFRNWIRNTWLPELEARQKGALKSLGRSLDVLSSEISDDSWVQDYITVNAIDRGKLLCLSKEKQLQVLAVFLYQKGHKNFKKSQLTELLKRLDSEKNNLTFRVMGLDWVVEPSKVYIS